MAQIWYLLDMKNRLVLAASNDNATIVGMKEILERDLDIKDDILEVHPNRLDCQYSSADVEALMEAEIERIIQEDESCLS